MVTTQANSWSSKTTVKKGDYGELLVDKFLESKGYVCYFPKTDGPHWFDRLAVKDKSKVIAAEVKTKARMNKYPATGFNKKHYLEYKRIYENHKIHVFVFFVDEMLGKIYGNFIQKLEQPQFIGGNKYPMEIGDVIVFPLINMTDIATLSQEDVKYLKSNSQRNYGYLPNS